MSAMSHELIRSFSHNSALSYDSATHTPLPTVIRISIFKWLFNWITGNYGTYGGMNASWVIYRTCVFTNGGIDTRLIVPHQRVERYSLFECFSWSRIVIVVIDRRRKNQKIHQNNEKFPFQTTVESRVPGTPALSAKNVRCHVNGWEILLHCSVGLDIERSSFPNGWLGYA